jgi:hypothetical protein
MTLTETLDRLIQLYDEWGKTAEAAAARKGQHARKSATRPE